MGAVLYTVAAQNAVPVVINQERVAGHGAAFMFHVTLITEPRLTGIDTELPVGAQLQGRGHGENGV